MPHQFDFIDEHFFRACMQADYVEMEKSLDASAWKSALVIAGSIVETLIVDSLIAAKPAETTKILSISLGAAIGAALQAKIITKRTADLASVVQDYRNLIHPGRSVRTKEQPNQEEAKIARALVDIIIREVSEERGKTQGMTSAQLINKIEIDSTASKLVKHYTKGMKEKEVRAFLLSDAPRRYFEIDATISDLGESSSAESFDELLRLSAVNACLSEAYRNVLKQVSHDVKSQVVHSYAQIMRDGTQEYIMKFTEEFFSAEYIEFLDGDSRELIKDYLLEVTGQIRSLRLLQAVEGLPQYLSEHQIGRFVDKLVKQLLSEKKGALLDALKSYLQNRISKEDDQHHAAIDERLNDWIEFVDDAEKKALLSEIVGTRNIPF